MKVNILIKMDRPKTCFTASEFFNLFTKPKVETLKNINTYVNNPIKKIKTKTKYTANLAYPGMFRIIN